MIAKTITFKEDFDDDFFYLALTSRSENWDIF